jgi:hypothetical protein
VVPGALALLPEYAGQHDPIAELREAATAAVAGLGQAYVLAATPASARVAEHLLTTGGHRPCETLDDALLVVANGSAMRTEKAPGHLDDRAEAFDADLAKRLHSGGLGGLDLDLAQQLWADVEALVELDRIVDLDGWSVEITYDDDPYGVKYWVVRASGTRR